jgi:hypothetical protein
MSPLVKTKRQGNFKDFKRLGAFKGLVEQKRCIQLVRVSIELFRHSWAFKTRVKRAYSYQKPPIYTRTGQINYYSRREPSQFIFD